MFEAAANFGLSRPIVIVIVALPCKERVRLDLQQRCFELLQNMFDCFSKAARPAGELSQLTLRQQIGPAAGVRAC